MIAYKLFKKRKNGTIGPLFINKKQIVPIREWIEAEDHKTSGYAHRPGWHCCTEPNAPHIARKENRVWYKVKVDKFEYFERPQSQGGLWILAKKLMVLGEIDD